MNVEDVTIEERVILFADIYGYLIIANELQPHGEIEFFQELYETLGDIIVAHLKCTGWEVNGKPALTSFVRLAVCRSVAGASGQFTDKGYVIDFYFHFWRPGAVCIDKVQHYLSFALCRCHLETEHNRACVAFAARPDIGRAGLYIGPVLFRVGLPYYE